MKGIRLSRDAHSFSIEQLNGSGKLRIMSSGADGNVTGEMPGHVDIMSFCKKNLFPGTDQISQKSFEVFFGLFSTIHRKGVIFRGLLLNLVFKK